ncbi:MULTISPECIES: zinc finger domain-containing protein [Aeromonas]|uniref:zinc finger domain-containing protein n=1 Tax=Aeromonas TaxID=642 RepID=UPI00140FE0F9|nr:MULTISPECIES: Com family DNA-binding transcriptional regulator [Aeromonas]NHT35779.1 Com family DNA-binding transcriptional regulator [Aeromonas hydrophila]HAU4976823.1 Com family DNA-binding transcriptional regulator [Aeromonas hydrophila]
MNLNELRCGNCSRMLARLSGAAEIKCPRCKVTNYASTSECQLGEIVNGKTIDGRPSPSDQRR